jgi:hypothetical protein
MTTETITRKKVIELVMMLPEDRLASVYDFARFVQSHPLELTAAEDIFGESADEIRADEEQWEQQFDASRDELRKMAQEAAAEYRAGQTSPLEFTPEGKPIR